MSCSHPVMRRHSSGLPPSPPSKALPRRLFESAVSSSPHSPTQPSAGVLFDKYCVFPASSSPGHESVISRRSSSSSSGGSVRRRLFSPLVARTGSSGSSTGGGRTGSNGSRFPESSIREEGPHSSSPEDSNSSYQSAGVNTLDVLGSARVEPDEGDEVEGDLPPSSPVAAFVERSYSSSSSTYSYASSRGSSFPGRRPSMASPGLASPKPSSSPGHHAQSSSPLRQDAFPSRQSTLKPSGLARETSPTSSCGSLEHDLLPLSPPPAGTTIGPAGTTSISSGRKSVVEDTLGLELGPPAETRMHAVETAEGDVSGGVEMLKKRRGMLREFETEWTDRFPEEAVEAGPVGTDANVLGLDLGPRRKVTLTIGQNKTKRKLVDLDAPDPLPETEDVAMSERTVPIIRLRVPAPPVPGPTSSSEDSVSPRTPSDEPSSPLSALSAIAKGKTSMRLVQDRSSPSVQSSSPSASKRARRSSSVVDESASGPCESDLGAQSAVQELPLQPELPLGGRPIVRRPSPALSSPLSSAGPSPSAVPQRLSLSPYSSLEPASSLTQLESQHLVRTDTADESEIRPPSPAPSSDLSSAPPSPQATFSQSLLNAQASTSATGHRVSAGRSTRNTARAAPPAGGLSRRTFPANLRIEPGYDRWYRNFSIPTPLPSDVASALGLTHPSSRPPRSLTGGKMNEGERGPMDLYSPRWIKGMGSSKVAVCPICSEDAGAETQVLKTKCSAFNYHLLHGHGICPSTGLPFSPPIAFRSVKRASVKPDEKKTIRQGKCHECKAWVSIEGVKDLEILVPEIYWWKHARMCHSTRVQGDLDIWKPSPLLDQLSTWIDGLAASSKTGWVIPSKHRTAPAQAAGPSRT